MLIKIILADRKGSQNLTHFYLCLFKSYDNQWFRMDYVQSSEFIADPLIQSTNSRYRILK